MVKITESMSDRMKNKFEAALTKTAAKKDYRTLDTLEKMVSGALPINYALVDRIIGEDVEIEPEVSVDIPAETPVVEPEVKEGYSIAEKIPVIKDIISELELALANADEDKKQSLELQLRIMNDKLNNLQSTTEDAPYQKKEFLDTNEDGTLVGDEIKESSAAYYNVKQELESAKKNRDKARQNLGKGKDEAENRDYREIYKNWDAQVNDLEKKLKTLNEDAPQKIVIKRAWGAEIKDYKAGDPIPSGVQFKIFNASDTKKIDDYADSLFEGCMTKKFESMTNREIANYIFNHPSTKFAGKIKECDDKEILNAIKLLKKEDAPVTTTAAVATPELPLKLKEKH